MSKRILPDLSIALTFIREGQGWSQTDLAKAAGTSPKVINDYEAGRKPPKRERVEYLVGFMDVPPERIDEVLSCLHGNRAASSPPRNPGDAFARSRRRIEATASVSGRATADFVRSQLLYLTVEGEGLYARQRAELLWNRLKKRTPQERRMMVDRARDFQNWALSERVALESIDLAPNHPQESLEAARLSLFIAQKVPGEALWRKRVEGYALTHVSNGLRVCNDLPAMGITIDRARKLWDEGEDADPGLLNPAVVPWIEAAVRKDQREFRVALKRIDEALMLDNGDLRGRILLTKSTLLDAVGNSKGSIEVLSEASMLIDRKRDPWLAFVLEFNLLWELCRMGRAAEAAARLDEIRQLAERLGGPLELARVVWLQGLVMAGLGRSAEAEAAFIQVRRDFEHHNLAYDYALVSLDLSLVLLERKQYGSVYAVAEEVLGIFKRLKVEREAVMALRIFCDAAKRETATIELAQRIVRFLRRVQHDPDLRFAETAGEGAD
jgi:transcriptional regulator with XRE-family HTH domain